MTNNQPLTGEELLRKVEENKDLLSELELMRTCGYVSKDKDGNDYQDFAAWWEAFLVAKGRGAFPPNPDFRAYWEADVQKKLKSIKQESGSSLLNSPQQKPQNSPPKENQSPLGVFPSSPLVGQELLDKIEELGDLDTLRRMDIVMRCGYISKREDGSDRVNYFAFYEEHARAQGLINQEESFIPADILKISEGEWNDYTEVIEDLRRRSKPKTAAEYLDRGCDKDDQKDSKGAIEDYTKAIELNPNYAEAYANRGCAKEELGDKEGAISDWQKAADLGDEEAARWIQELKGKGINNQSEVSMQNRLNNLLTKFWELTPFSGSNSLPTMLQSQNEDGTINFSYSNGIQVSCFYTIQHDGKVKVEESGEELNINNMQHMFAIIGTIITDLYGEFDADYVLKELMQKELPNIFKEDDHDRAVKFLQSAHKKHNSEDYEGAIEDYSRAIDLEKNDARLYCLRGFCKLDTEDWEGGIADLSNGIAIDPNIAESYGTDLYGARGYAMNQLDDYESAIKNYDKAIKIDPNDSNIYINRARSKINLFNEKGAIEDYTKAIDIDPKNIEFYFLRGVAEMNSEAFKEALSDFRKVIEMDPEYADAYANIGEIFIDEVGDFTETAIDAIPYLDKSIELNKYAAQPYYYRSQVKRELKDFKGALSDALKAYEIDPEYRDEMESMIASDCYQLGKYEEAIDFINREIKKYDDYVYEPLYIELSRYKNALGDIEGAKSDLMVALNATNKKISESDEFEEAESAMINRAEIKELLNDFEGAISDYKQLIELGFPNYKEGHLLKSGNCKKKLGDLKGACEDWKKAAELGDEDAAKLVEEHCE